MIEVAFEQRDTLFQHNTTDHRAKSERSCQNLQAEVRPSINQTIVKKCFQYFLLHNIDAIQYECCPLDDVASDRQT